MERLSALDATFLYFETSAQHQHVCAVMVVDPSTMPGGYHYEKIKEHIASRLTHFCQARVTAVRVVR